MAAYYKVEVSLGTNAVEVGIPSPQSVNVVLPLIGPQGEVGAVGPTGPTGSTGPANSLAIGTVTTGAEGSGAAAAITGTAPSQTLSLTIPVGATGATGPANSLDIGTVSTGAPGSNAAATVTGTAPAQTLNLTIPRGDVGATGATGAVGPTGPAGTATTDASELTTGTLDDARLSANVPLKDAANTFSANQTLDGTNNTAPNQTAASGSSLMTRDLGDARYGGQTFVAMASGVTMTQNNTTPEDIAGASLVLPAGTYIITVKMFFAANASAGSKMVMAFDGTSSQRGFRQTITTSVVQAVSIGSFGSISSATAAETEHYRLYECVVTAQGTLKLQGAQNVAGINPLTASGFLKAEKIS